jgi:hypothetical protein
MEPQGLIGLSLLKGKYSLDVRIVRKNPGGARKRGLLVLPG